MKILYSLPLVLLFMLGLFKKPPHLDSTYESKSSPIVLMTSLDDTLPLKVVKLLNLENVRGIKIQYPDGHFSSYFEYSADHNALLRALSQSPFSINATIADAICHQIDFRELDTIKQRVSPHELENAASFWTSDRADLEVHECVKPPLKHTVLTSKNSNRILHRVEFIG